jgi:adenylylsulfate kinase
MIIQFCGLSGVGKTTLAKATEKKLKKHDLLVEVIDGDEYRRTLCRDLGFSKEDRRENMRRLAFVAGKLSEYGIISIISAINPYEGVRKEIHQTYRNVKTIYIYCSLQTLKQRDTKGLYKKALLSDHHPDKITNLSGVNDPFEIPLHPDLFIDTDKFSVDDCTEKILDFILAYVIRAKVISLEFTRITRKKHV